MASPKAKRADFALPNGRFPMNTPGRRAIASMDAKHALNHGTITKAQYKEVVAKSGRTMHKPPVKNGHPRGKRP